MADFSLAQIGGPSGSSVQPKQGVQEPSAVEAASSLFSGIVQSFANSQPSLSERRYEAEAERQQKLSVAGSRFATQQLQIADAVDQGGLSSQEARMRMRANYASAISNNPELTDEITKIHKDLIGTKGLGAVAAEGTQKEQAFNAAMTQATKDGWVTSDMSQEQAAEATANWQSFNLAQQQIDAAQNEIALQRANIGLRTDRIGESTAQISNQKARLELQQKKLEVKSRQALGSMGDAFLPKFRNDAQAVLSQVERGEIDQKEAIDRLDGQWSTVQSLVYSVGSEAGQSHISNLTTPMRTVYENTRKRILGEIDTEVYDAQVENATAQQAAMLSGDPKIVQAVAVSKLLPNAPSIQNLAIDSVVANMLEKNSREEGSSANLTDPEDDAQVTDYLNLVKSNLRGVNSGGELIGGKEAEKEVQTNLNQILKGVSAYSAAVDSPEQFNKLVDFFASSDFGDYAAGGGGKINSQYASNAKEVLQQQYEQAVLPLIEQEWSNASVTTSTLPTSPTLGTTATEEEATSVIQPSWSGTGVSFVSQDRSNTRVNAKVRDLNKRVAPVLNRLIRMGAHLQGTKNYKQVYEANYAGLFGTGESEGDTN